MNKKDQVRYALKPEKLVKDESLAGEKHGVADGKELRLPPAVHYLISRSESQQELNHILDHLPIKRIKESKTEKIMISMSRGLVLGLTNGKLA